MTLEKLMTLPGALAAFEFRGSGELLTHHVGHHGIIDKTVLDLLAHMCAADISIATMQARGWEALTDMHGFYPVRQFTLIGFDWSVIVSGLRREAKKNAGEALLPPFMGVVVANESADYQAAYAMLEEE
jgi:roadblock/LC7 domain-containing protein